MIKFIIGLALFVFGLMIFPIPIIGWFFGILSMLIGFIMILSGLFSDRNDSEVEVVYHDFDHPLNEERRKERARQIQMEENLKKPSVSDELQKLSELYEKGHLTKEEFDSMKKELIN